MGFLRFFLCYPYYFQLKTETLNEKSKCMSPAVGRVELMDVKPQLKIMVQALSD